jgi:hypothetical protein
MGKRRCFPYRNLYVVPGAACTIREMSDDDLIDDDDDLDDEGGLWQQPCLGLAAGVSLAVLVGMCRWSWWWAVPVALLLAPGVAILLNFGRDIILTILEEVGNDVPPRNEPHLRLPADVVDLTKFRDRQTTPTDPPPVT